MVQYTIRVDDADKRAAAEVAEYYGLDLASVTRAFYKEMIRSHSIPLPLGREELPNEESLQAIRESNKFFASGKKGRFTNGHDLIEAALK